MRPILLVVLNRAFQKQFAYLRDAPLLVVASWSLPGTARHLLFAANKRQSDCELRSSKRREGSILPATTVLRGLAGVPSIPISKLQAFFEQELHLLTEGTSLLFRDFVQS